MVLTAIVLFATLSAAEPAGAADLHEQVVRTYNFHPHRLSDNEIDAKSADLDRFWTLVKSRGDAGLAQLRAELARNDAPVFFRYDGAKLLLSMSESKADRELALRSISRADLEDVQRDDYFYTVHSLAVAGLDTTAAALKILGDPQFAVFVPQHVLTINQASALLYLLLPTDESFYVQALIDRLAVEKERTAITSILSLLAFLTNPEADAAIKAYAADETRPKDLREYAAQIAAAAGDPLPAKELAALKEARRRELAKVSDESIIEGDRLTREMRKPRP